MSSSEHLGPEAATSEGGAEGANMQPPAISTSEKAPALSSNNDDANVEVGGKVASSQSAVANDLPPPQRTNDSRSDVASEASNASQPESKGTRTTRSRVQSMNGDDQLNGGRRYQEQESPEVSNAEDDHPSTFVDAVASSLARLDEDAYKRAVFKDANSILENILFPMSFPWAHYIDPVVRNIPRDIDEMPGIILMEDAGHQVCSLKDGNFDLAKHELTLYDSDDDDDDDDAIRAVARRADDPGIIELKTCAPSLESHERAALPDAIRTGCKASIILRDPLIEPCCGAGSEVGKPSNGIKLDTPDEVAFHAFEEMQAEKRRKLEIGMARLKTTFVSVKVESTSSRSVLFDTSGAQSKLPLLLPAVYPQDFRPMTKGKNPSRGVPGRNQMVWMEKTPSRTSHRVVYKSYITSEKVDSGVAKRPRDVSVGVRVNGKLLSSASISVEDLKHDASASNNTSSSKRKRNEGKPASLYSSKIINDALDEVCSKKEAARAHRQCTFYPEIFTSRVLREEKSIGWNMKMSIKSLNLVYVAPRIDCLPAEDALFRVVCTSPGELPSANVEDVLQQAAKNNSSTVCTVCWRETSITGECVSECTDCGVLVHLESCQSTTEFDKGKKKCASCSMVTTLSPSPRGQPDSPATPASPNARRSSRLPSSKTKEGGFSRDDLKSLSCALCPHKGGAMSMLSQERRSAWVHDVCRTWCDQGTDQPSPDDSVTSRKAKEPSEGPVVDVCALCGASSDEMASSNKYNGIVKCAASGCSVYFHPMCALYLSKCEEIGAKDHEKPSLPMSNGGAGSGSNDVSGKDHSKPRNGQDQQLEKLLENDKFLCRQYSLRFAKCVIPGSRNVGRSSVRSSPSRAAVLPVCFCGIHNPKRDRSLYGLYPGGQLIDEQVIRVPPAMDAGRKGDA